MLKDSKTALWKKMSEPSGPFRNILSIGKQVTAQLVHILKINNQAKNSKKPTTEIINNL